MLIDISESYRVQHYPNLSRSTRFHKLGKRTERCAGIMARDDPLREKALHALSMVSFLTIYPCFQGSWLDRLLGTIRMENLGVCQVVEAGSRCGGVLSN